jgi:hypothetical protein
LPEQPELRAEPSNPAAGIPWGGTMKLIIICILTAAIMAAPCIHDPASREPSPMAGLLAVTSTFNASQF